MNSRQEALWPCLALGMLMAVASVVIYRKGFGTTFYFDDWSFLMDRRPWRQDIFLEPYNGHLSVVPIAIYKLLFVTVGIDSVAPYRVVLLGLHLLCVALLFAYARRRVGDWLAVLVAASLLFLGSGWHDLLVPFQISFLVSVAAVLGALLLQDRRGWGADVGIAVLVALSLGSSSIGIPLAAGVLAETALRRDRLRRLWVPLAPIALYLLWYVEHRDSPQGTAAAVGPVGDIIRHNVPIVPSYAVEAAAGAFAGLAGLAIEWGRPAVVLGAIVLIWWLLGRTPVTARLGALFVMAGVYWALLGLLRAQVTSPSESRYVYFGAVLVLLLAVELLRGTRLSHRAFAVVGALVAVAALGNFGSLRNGSLFLQEWSGVVVTELGALELAGAQTDPGYRPDPTRLPPVTAGAYFASVGDLGSPADTPEELLARPDGHRQIADNVLVQALPIATEPVRALPASGCRTVRSGSIETPVMDGAVIHASGKAPAEYRLRSFADTFPQAAHGTVALGATVLLRVPPRDLPRPWRLRVDSSGPFELCPAQITSR